MYTTKEIEEIKIISLEKIIREEFEEIEIRFARSEDKEIDEIKHIFLKSLYKSILPFERTWLRNEYPNIRKWHMEKFPTLWMTKNSKIAAIIERCHAFIPIVNYLFQHNKSWRGNNNKKERINMQELADKITDKKRYAKSGHEYVYSTFLTNKAFYDEICKHTHCSKGNIQRYLKALVKVGCLKILNEGKGGKGVLYADGYYVPAPDNKYRKISFLKDSSEIKSGLIKLPNWINEYQTNLTRRVKRHV
jgi:hypothetical protein